MLNPEQQQAYIALYHAFHQLNTICWQGRLPRCVLVTSRRMRSALGYATNERPCRIALNVPLLLTGTDAHVLGVLAHEMTHIWQYHRGTCGGHGPDFHREMRRIGIDEKHALSLPDTPFHYCAAMRRAFRQDLILQLQILNRYPFHRNEELEFFQIYQNQLFQ